MMSVGEQMQLQYACFEKGSSDEWALVGVPASASPRTNATSLAATRSKQLAEAR